MVLLTLPVPELLDLLRLEGTRPWLEACELRSALEGVQYSSRYALSLFFQPHDAELFAQRCPWVAKYVTKEEDERLVFISHDSAKRGASPAPTLLVHSSVPYGIRQQRAKTEERQIEAELLESVQRQLPWMPTPASVALHTWRHSQVRYPVAGLQGASFSLVPPAGGGSDAPTLILAGDAFSALGSRFDGCVESGEHAACSFLKSLPQ